MSDPFAPAPGDPSAALPIWSDPDAAIARIEQQVAEAQRAAARANDMKDRMDALRGRGGSSRGEVRVEVEVTGRLTNLVLADNAYDYEPRALSALILDTIQKAQRDASAQAIELTEETFGEASPVTARLRDELARFEAPTTTVSYE